MHLRSYNYLQSMQVRGKEHELERSSIATCIRYCFLCFGYRVCIFFLWRKRRCFYLQAWKDSSSACNDSLVHICDTGWIFSYTFLFCRCIYTGGRCHYFSLHRLSFTPKKIKTLKLITFLCPQWEGGSPIPTTPPMNLSVGRAIRWAGPQSCRRSSITRPTR